MTVPIVGKMMPIMKRTVFKIICLKTFWVVLLTSIWSDSTSANLKGSCKKKSKSPLQTFNLLLSDCFHTGRGPESTKGALGHCSRYSVLRLPVGRLKIGWDRKLSKCKQFVNVWPSEWHDMCFCRTLGKYLDYHTTITFALKRFPSFFHQLPVPFHQEVFSRNCTGSEMYQLSITNNKRFSTIQIHSNLGISHCLLCSF